MEFGPRLPDEQDHDLEPEIPSTLMQTLRGHEGPVLAVRFNVQGSYCISCGKVLILNPFSMNSSPGSHCSIMESQQSSLNQDLHWTWI